MRFTRRKPSKPGYYWWRPALGRAATVVKIGKRIVIRRGSWWMHNLDNPCCPNSVGEIVTEVWGPKIEEPDDG